MISTSERIRLCLILEEIKNNKEAANRLGLRDASRIKTKSKTKMTNTRSYSKK